MWQGKTPPSRLEIPAQGKGPATKSDEFSEKFQTAFDPPPPHCRKIMLQYFYDGSEVRFVNAVTASVKFLPAV